MVGTSMSDRVQHVSISASGYGTGGGGAGASHWRLMAADQLAATEAITIGSGGAGGAGNNDGTGGGASDFGGIVRAFGGGAGRTNSASAIGGGGGAPAHAHPRPRPRRDHAHAHRARRPGGPERTVGRWQVEGDVEQEMTTGKKPLLSQTAYCAGRHRRWRNGAEMDFFPFFPMDHGKEVSPDTSLNLQRHFFPFFPSFPPDMERSAGPYFLPRARAWGWVQWDYG